MLRIGICDDESRAREALRFLIETLTDEEKGEEVVYEFSNGVNAVRWLKGHKGEIDLLFLDVEMEGLSGMEAAQEIRKFDQNIIIVFVTGYSDYVFEGYRVQALDYLLKPAREEKLDDVLMRARERITNRFEDEFTFQNSEGIYRFYRNDILYCFSEKRKVNLVTRDRVISMYAKLDQAQEKLGPGFIRIHQRYLVNADSVKEMRGNSVLIGEEELPVSRALKAEATIKLAKALLGGGNK